jgi:hypothetical protein
LTNGSTAFVALRSIISSPAGMMPAAMIAVTALPALTTSSNEAMTTRASFGRGTSLSVTSVTTINSPSEPIVNASRSRPGLSSAAPPKAIGSPSIV